MARKEALSPEPRQFFKLVAQVVFTNPFSDERLKLDAEIAGDPKVAALDRRARLERMSERTARQLQNLQARGFHRLQDFTDEDRQLMEYVYLFDIYHRFMSDLDQLIQRQVEMKEAPAPVPFAKEALALLSERGYPLEQAQRFFAIFFQLRRAYYFIDEGLIGRSPSMKKLRLALWNNVFTHDHHLYDRYLWNRMENFSTLLLGETGTGKGTAAAAIGRSSFIPFDGKKNSFAESFTRTFVAINLSQFPESLIESELFGHCKGSFTGAIDDHDGVFSLCSSHGAIFLDEIGEVSAPVQIKMLQILQERTFSPVGSHKRRRFEGRVIAATNKPIDQLRLEGRFRDDFFYRLCSDVITVPTLRQRIAEDPAELEELLNLIVERTAGEPAPELARMIREVLEQKLPRDYPWPGNVRELEQAVRRILLTRDYQGDAKNASADQRSQLREGMESGLLNARAVLCAYCRLLFQRYGTYEEVARRTDLDRRTVKKYIQDGG